MCDRSHDGIVFFCVNILLRNDAVLPGIWDNSVLHDLFNATVWKIFLRIETYSCGSVECFEKIVTRSENKKSAKDQSRKNIIF